MGNGVLTGRQTGCAQIFSIQRPVDVLLQMFCPDAHRKGLGLQINALIPQGEKAVTGAVTNGQHRHITGQLLPLQLQACQAVFPQQKAFCLGLKADDTAKCFHLTAHRYYDIFQQIGADMGLGCLQRIMGRTVLFQQLQHQLAAVVTDTSGQLTVRIGTCAAFAKLDVGTLVQCTA